MKTPGLSIAIAIGFIAIGAAAMAQNAPAPQQPAPTPAPQEPAATTPAPQPPARGRGTPAPTRDPQTPGYVAATMLPDGAVPPRRAYRQLRHRADAYAGSRNDGAARRAAGDGPQLHDGIDRQQDLSGHRARSRVSRSMVDPNDPAKRIVNSGPAPYTRRVAVYVPQQYVPGTIAPRHRRRGRSRSRCCSRRSTT